MRFYAISAVAAALLLTPAAAGAQSQQTTAPQLSAKEQAMLDALPYTMRQYVMSRMGPEQKVPELVETTLLNRMANPDYKALRNVVVVYRAEAQRPSGEWVAVEIDPVTYAVLQPVRVSATGAAPDRTGSKAAAGSAAGAASGATTGAAVGQTPSAQQPVQVPTSGADPYRTGSKAAGGSATGSPDRTTGPAGGR